MAASSSSTLSFFLFIILLSWFAAVFSSYTFASSDGLRNKVLNDDGDDHHDISFAALMRHPIEAIYQFGDSIADTGNLIRADPHDNCGHYPYGKSFFDVPTGRFSDGLIMIDFFAKFLKLPLIDPYLNKDGNFSHGVNFAVGGATVLDASTLAEQYGLLPSTNLSLPVQLRWFKSHLDSSSLSTSEHRSKLAQALFFMGEVGGNDYNYAFFMGRQIRDVYKMVPQVIQGIKRALEEIIDLGATRIAVPGNFPVGCMTCYLRMFKTNDLTMYDETKCLKNLNDFAQFHNNQLQEIIEHLQKSFPHVTIAYVDYFAAMKGILQDATTLGFDENDMFKACCGIGDDEYNVDVQMLCGTDGVPVCENPKERVSWDGAHLTQHAYQEMAKWLVRHTSPSSSTI